MINLTNLSLKEPINECLFNEHKVLWLKEHIEQKFRENPELFAELLDKEGRWLS